MVEMRGFEPPTPALRTRCSPAELHPHYFTASFSPIDFVFHSHILEPEDQSFDNNVLMVPFNSVRSDVLIT